MSWQLCCPSLSLVFLVHNLQHACVLMAAYGGKDCKVYRIFWIKLSQLCSTFDYAAVCVFKWYSSWVFSINRLCSVCVFKVFNSLASFSIRFYYQFCFVSLLFSLFCIHVIASSPQLYLRYSLPRAVKILITVNCCLFGFKLINSAAAAQMTHIIVLGSAGFALYATHR